jgi:2-dehydro-3-deoxygalactonokinase
MNAPPFFFSCDWGTTSFRLRFVSRLSRQVLLETRKGAGVKELHSAGPVEGATRAERFAQVLREALRELHPQLPEAGRGEQHPVVISGMASSSIGWKELPYANVPLALDRPAACYEKFELTVPGLGSSLVPVFLLSGVATGSDIMRGEETEVVGLLSQPEFSSLGKESVVVLPGSHSKHVYLRGGMLVDFQTYMTGELFEVLGTRSILSASVEFSKERFAGEPEAALPGGEAEAAFLEGVDCARRKGLAQGLFRVRTRSVLQKVDPGVNARFLSGLLIGAELNNLAGQNRRGAPILLAASGKVAAPYRSALEALGMASQVVAATAQQTETAAVHGHALFLDGLATAEHP